MHSVCRDTAIFNAMRWDDTVHFHSYISVCNKRSLRTIIHYHHLPLSPPVGMCVHEDSFIRSVCYNYHCHCIRLRETSINPNGGRKTHIHVLLRCIFSCQFAKEWFEWGRETYAQIKYVTTEICVQIKHTINFIARCSLLFHCSEQSASMCLCESKSSSSNVKKRRGNRTSLMLHIWICVGFPSPI